MEDCLGDMEGSAEEARGVTEGKGGTQGVYRRDNAGGESWKNQRQKAGA